MSEGEMDSAFDTRVREFMLGLSEQDSGAQVEDGILNGTIDADQLHLVEDELIDDYLLGTLSPQEEQAFTAHFLRTHDRKQKVALARGLMQHVRLHTAAAKDAFARPRSQPPQFFWRWTSVAGMVASVLLTILLGFQMVRSNRQAQVAREAQDHENGLRAELTLGQNQPATDSLPNLVLTQGITRGVPSLPQLHLPPHSPFVWIRVPLPVFIQGTYSVELLTDAGTSLWMEEFQAASKHSPTISDFAIPTSLLLPGSRYRIRLEEASTAASFEELKTYAFQVAAN
jgi:hypothetical protein